MKTRVLAGVCLLGLAVAWAALGQAPPVQAPPPPAAAAPAPPPQQPAPAAPQEAPAAKPSAAEERDIRDLAEIVMAVRLAKELNLDDEQTVVMVRRFSEFRDKGDELRKERQELSKALKAALRAKDPDDQITAKLNALIEQDGKIAAHRKDAYEKVVKDLNPASRAKLYLFLGEFESEMKQLIQRVRERRMENLGLAPAAPRDDAPRAEAAPRRGPGGNDDGGGPVRPLRQRLLGEGFGRAKPAEK